MPESAAALMQQLHDEHAAALWGYCLRLTGQDHARAEDVVQETLLRAWRNHDRLDESRGSVRAWLFTVARNIVIDEWRSQTGPERALRRPRCPRPAGADDGTDQLLLSWVVAEAVTSLSADHRAVLLECYFRGASVAQAAHRLGHPRGNREVADPLRPAGAAPGSPGDGGGGMTCEMAHLDGCLRARGALTRRATRVRATPGGVRASAAGPCASWPACRGCWPRSTSATSSRHAGPPLPPTLLPSLVREVRGSERRRSVLIAVVAGSVAATVAAVAVGGLAVGGAFDDGREPTSTPSTTVVTTTPTGHAHDRRRPDPGARRRAALRRGVGNPARPPLLVRGRRGGLRGVVGRGVRPRGPHPRRAATSRWRRGGGCRAGRCACPPRLPPAGATSRRWSCGRPTGSSSSGCPSD